MAPPIEKGSSSVSGIPGDRDLGIKAILCPAHMSHNSQDHPSKTSECLSRVTW